ncbi:MAG TPA: biopolymer transporter ExbD, partial [Aquabacterium sp.]|nr:biopolymer transporter ExbD [Aquabacterium sp.]
MAFGRLERTQGSSPMSEINMTPLIDVMLVLLVIFMLTAPLMTSSLKLDLPKTEGTQPQDPNPQALKLTLTASGELRWNEEVMAFEELRTRLEPLKGGKTEVHLKADRAVPYGRVAEVLGMLQAAGLH